MSLETTIQAIEEMFQLTKELIKENDALRLENQRLKEGNFTPEEFQNLCHNLGRDCTLPVFDQGCKSYQESLFGKDVCEQYRRQP